MYNIMSPKSLAIIGASRKQKKWGYELTRNIIEQGYRGEIYLVNARARGEKIFYRKVYGSVKELPENIDLGIILTPAFTVLKVIDECIEKKIKGLVIITAGFGETGDKGKLLEKKILDKIKKAGINVIGPNCTGIANMSINLNATLEPKILEKGNISFITQSGAFAGAVIGWFNEEKLGMNKVISVGNKIDIDEIALLKFLAEDRDTRTMMMYIEGFDKKSGRELIKTSREIIKKKPIIILKAGVSEGGAKAAASHTGSMSGKKEIFDAAIKKAGMIQAKNMEELLDFSKVLSMQPPMEGDVCIVSNAGGMGILAADECEKIELKLAKLSSKVSEELKKHLPDLAVLDNPIDMVGDANVERYNETLKIVLKDKNVGGVIVIFQAPLPTFVDSASVAETVAETAKTSEKPIVACWTGGFVCKEGVEILRKNNIPNFPTPERAVKALGALKHYKENQRFCSPSS